MAAAALYLYEEELGPAEASGSLPLVEASGSLGSGRPDSIAPQLSIWYVSEIQTQDGLLSLREPLRIEFTRGEDVPFVAYAKGIEVGGVGNTQLQAIADLSETAWMLWRSLAEDDAPMDESARAALARLARLFTP